MQIKEGLINTLFKILNGTASIWDLLMRMSLLFLLNKKCFRMLYEYSDAAEPPVRCGVSHLSGQA